MYNIFIDLNFVSFAYHGVEYSTDLALTGGSDFVVMYFSFGTHLVHNQAHCRAQVL